MEDNAIGNIDYSNSTVISALNLQIPPAWTFATSYVSTHENIRRSPLDSSCLIQNDILNTDFSNLYWSAENASFGLPLDFENINIDTAKAAIKSLANGINIIAAARIVDAAMLRLTRSFAHRLLAKQKVLFDAKTSLDQQLRQTREGYEQITASNELYSTKIADLQKRFGAVQRQLQQQIAKDEPATAEEEPATGDADASTHVDLSTTVTPYTKVKLQNDLYVFSGTKKERIDAWIRTAERIMTLGQLNSEYERITFASTRLRDYAQVVFENIESNNKILTWDILKRELLDKFKAFQYQHKLRDRLMELRMKESIDQYVIDFETLLHEAFGMHELDKIIYFKNGLKDSVREYINLERKDTLKETILRASQFSEYSRKPHSDALFSLSKNNTNKIVQKNDKIEIFYS